jgi:hypothetical protein
MKNESLLTSLKDGDALKIFRFFGMTLETVVLTRDIEVQLDQGYLYADLLGFCFE